MSKQNHESIPASVEMADTPPGLRLRRAREDAGLTTAEVATRLRLRVALIVAMEREDLAALGAPVFARGYVDSYARLLGLPVTLVDELLPRAQAEYVPSPLENSARLPRSRELMDRFARRFVYVALTASIVIPVVLLATREPLPDPATLLTPLDVPTDVVAGARAGVSADASVRDEAIGPPAPTEQAVMASFTPFYGATRTAAAPSVAAAATVQALVLDLSGDSWIEVVGTDGSRLVHDLLHAGVQQTFDPSKVAQVLIGNAAGVNVSLNGKEVDITPYQRANVARFAVSSDGLVAPPGG